MNTRRMSILIALLGALLIAPAVLAQDAGLTLDLQRNWGYGGFNNDIQGAFSLKAGGPADLARVEFFIDATKIGEATHSPFNIEFVTDDYPNGLHTLTAKGTTTSGKQLASQPLTAQFIAASEGSKTVLSFVAPILVLVFGAIVLAAVVPILSGRKGKTAGAPGTQRQYPMGGGLCPKCGTPVAFHLWGLNIPGGKFERCPACGKWSYMRYKSLDKLRAAEQAEISSQPAMASVVSDEERMKKALDESKYV